MIKMNYIERRTENERMATKKKKREEVMTIDKRKLNSKEKSDMKNVKEIEPS